MNTYIINSREGNYVADVSKLSETVKDQCQIETVNIINKDTLEFSTKNVIYLSKVDNPPTENIVKSWNEGSDTVIYEVINDDEPPII